MSNEYNIPTEFSCIHSRYTEGIRVKCGDAETEASLYNNRAAAHFHLKNYRSSLSDCEKALTFNPNHTKARLRAAKSAYEVAKYDICIEHCQKYLEIEPDDNTVKALLNNAKKKKQMQERDQRKKEKIDSKKAEQKESIVKAIIDRGIRVSNCDDEDDIDLSKLEPSLPGAQDAVVHIEDGILKWPVLFLYPEYQMTDFIRGCPENVPLHNQLEQLFPAPWDEGNKYTPSSVNVYYEGYDKMPHVVDIVMKLGDLLLLKYFELKAGTPAFFILPRGSQVEARFLESYI